MSKGQFEISGHQIANGERCFIITEVTQAHDGSLGTAHAFIDAIVAAGADAVKFQTHIAEAESSPMNRGEFVSVPKMRLGSIIGSGWSFVKNSGEVSKTMQNRKGLFFSVHHSRWRPSIYWRESECLPGRLHRVR